MFSVFQLSNSTPLSQGGRRRHETSLGSAGIATAGRSIWKDEGSSQGCLHPYQSSQPHIGLGQEQVAVEQVCAFLGWKSKL